MPLSPANLRTGPDPDTGTASVRTEVLDQQGLLKLGKVWDCLTENALEENAYFCRKYAEALLTHVEHRPLKALAVWQHDQLIALLPFTQSRRRWGGLAKLNHVWTTPYSMLSVPLIHKQHADLALRCLTTAMGDGSTGSTLWLFDNLALDGTAGKEMLQHFKAAQNPFCILDPFDRAILRRQGDFAAHMKEHVSKKRRKDLVRNRKRLSELGTLTLTDCSAGADLNDAVEEFLRIEAAGWKGKRGTALNCNANTRAFAKQAFGDPAGAPITRADVLALDGRAIAVNLSLQTGRTAFTIKCAFDEEYRNYGAGLLLEEDMIREMLEGNWADKLDSATAPGHLIQGLWNSSTRIADLLIAAGPGSLPFSFCEKLEKTRRKTRQVAKTLFLKLRG